MGLPTGYRATASVAPIPDSKSAIRYPRAGTNPAYPHYMSTAARPALAVPSAPAAHWAPWAMVAADVLGIEIAFLIGLSLRRLLGPWFPNGVGPDQYLGVAAGILLLPIINYQLGLYPGYLLSPVERLRRRMLATVGVFGGLVAWDNL